MNKSVLIFAAIWCFLFGMLIGMLAGCSSDGISYVNPSDDESCPELEYAETLIICPKDGIGVAFEGRLYTCDEDTYIYLDCDNKPHFNRGACCLK